MRRAFIAIWFTIAAVFLLGVCEAASPGNYDGLYYLHDELPRFGQNIGNLHDVGELRRSRPAHHDEGYTQIYGRQSWEKMKYVHKFLYQFRTIYQWRVDP